ncbi:MULTISPECIES: TRAP transporter small permease [unclassified Halomonas]|uniref:TRAP transporter small permease n=1 Tax=unclassified Halomonas TaxID=2609666 RepID=UPI001C9856F6|nr:MULTISPECIES: TRAP transporter small permease [unclassified Halomonas]MBY5925165.1 TRAP transporter small permease [Halomonas sp. DP4Y7-2]MBY6232206.1 TRAP transporter small permease [Halomonas sp. DP4Y7-1]
MSIETSSRPAGSVNLAARLCRWISPLVTAITTLFMALSAVGVLAAMLLIGYSVIARYLLGSPSLWVDDVVTFVLVGIVMCATASALREGRHLGVDLMTERLGQGHRRWVQAWSMIAVLVVAVFLVVDGWQTAMFSRMLGMTTIGYVQIPLYLLQLMIPFGGAMLAMVALESLLRLAGGGHAFVKADSCESHVRGGRA